MRKHSKSALIIGGVAILIAVAILFDLQSAAALALIVPAYLIVLLMREAGEEISNWDRRRITNCGISRHTDQSPVL